MKRYVARVTFPGIRPAHKNFFVGQAQAMSLSTGVARAMRDVVRQLHAEKKAHRIHLSNKSCEVKITLVWNKISEQKGE